MWRASADVLRTYGSVTAALILERCADDVEAALAQQAVAPLTLREAAAESGYSTDHLSRLVRAGVVTNVGRPHAPLIRRGELPRKVKALRPPRADAMDRMQIVRSVVTSKKEHHDG
jgi:hypothetical protein